MVNWRYISRVCLAQAVGLVLLRAAAAAGPLVELRGTDFAGGAKKQFGSRHYGREGVNYVYAKSTGAHATMRATFTLPRADGRKMALFLTARDDDAPTQCDVEVTLNGRMIVRGPSGFPDNAWRVRRFAIPPGTLKDGANELVVANREKAGQLGMPPWFMVARCIVADADFKPPPPKFRKPLAVKLPDRARPFPQPLPDGAAGGGFKIRGIKGWRWTPEQYLQEIPVLARGKMNFLMNCYTSMYSHHPQFRNEWWRPISDARKEAYGKVIRACRAGGIRFCFAIHPQLHSPRPLDPASEADFEKLWPHFDWAQRQGVKWFSICLDDVHIRNVTAGGVSIDGDRHAGLVNKLFERLRRKDPRANFVFCPTWYWSDGTGAKHRPYLATLARRMHKDVYVFWTGPGVVSLRIGRRAAETYKGIVKHRLILWDNYPVNDDRPTLHLGPLTGRDGDLHEVIDGYMSNPLCTQNQINRIPMLTCADYAYNPAAYDPARSIGQAIVHLAETDPQRQALKDLVEAYPGMLICGRGSTGLNPVREHLNALASPEAAGAYVTKLEGLATRLDRLFPDRFGPARKTLRDDIAWMKRSSASQVGRRGPPSDGGHRDPR